jgi:ATPase family associated with various cellular activities (AAA)
VFSSVQEVSDGLRKAGYIADSVAITTVFLASSLHRPVFSEGPAGSGKTQLAYAVAQAANTSVERLQCYEGIGEDKAIGKFDESLQRLCVELKAKASGVDWELLKSELHGEQFFRAGPLLRALKYERPCVLLIDELDKVDHAFEAQAFKRAAACFGLGRYLYYFEGFWVDLDDRKRPQTVPSLPQWATPEGWRKGMRPNTHTTETGSAEKTGNRIRPDNKSANTESGDLVRQIEAMAKPLGRRLYRGVLRIQAKVWNPDQIRDVAMQRKVLEQMQSAERGLGRLHAALSKTGPAALEPALQSLKLRSLEHIDSLGLLKQVVLAVEAAASTLHNPQLPASLVLFSSQFPVVVSLQLAEVPFRGTSAPSFSKKHLP